MTKITQEQLVSFLTANPNSTAVQVAANFNVTVDTARKALRLAEGLQPTRQGKVITWTVAVRVGRLKPNTPEHRHHKIIRYVRAACYNVAKLQMSEKQIHDILQGWFEEYTAEGE